MMDLLQTSNQMWVWANQHPYLFTIIRLGQPSVWAIIIYAGSRIISNFVNTNKRGVFK
jgi:hypothetical protein